MRPQRIPGSYIMLSGVPKVNENLSEPVYICRRMEAGSCRLTLAVVWAAWLGCLRPPGGNHQALHRMAELAWSSNHVSGPLWWEGWQGLQVFENEGLKEVVVGM